MTDNLVAFLRARLDADAARQHLRQPRRLPQRGDAMTDETVEPCDGRHPLIWPDGRQTYLYDLASHPGCPHQPWAAPEDEDALRGYADAKHTLAGSLRQMMGMLDDSSPMEAALGKVASVAVAQLDAPSPIRAILWPNFGAPAELQAPCYRTASGLAVHVRSGCRC